MLVLGFVYRFLCGCHGHQWGLNHWGLQYHNLMEYTLGRHMCLLVMVCGPHQEFSEKSFLPLLQVGGSFMLLIHCPQAFLYSWAYSSGGLAEIHLIPLPFLYSGERGILFQVVFQLITWSTLNMWWMLNLVIGLINLHASGQQCASLLNHTFTLVSWAGCQL